MKNGLFNELGLQSGKELICSVLGLKAYPFLNMQIWGTALAGIVSFSQRHIWDPPSVIVFVVLLTLVNAWYGLQVSRKIYRVGFSMDKLHKTFYIVIADLVIMGIVNFAIQQKDYYGLLGDALFGYFFFWKLRQIWVHMKLLDLQKGEFTGIFGNYLESILKSKFGADLVDELNKPKTHPEDQKEKVIN